MDPFATPTALVADDDRDIRELVCLILRRAGYLAHGVSGGDAALARARLVRPDLAVLDVNMPDRNGLDVCRALKQDTRSALAVLLMSADCGAAQLAASAAAGADGFLAKPFAPHELADHAMRLRPGALSSAAPAAQEAGPSR